MDWRERMTTVVENMADSYFESEAERLADIDFVNEVFDDLRKIVKRMYE